MDLARRGIHNHGSQGLEVNAGPSKKAVEPLPAAPVQTSATAGEHHEPDQKRPEKRADAWMENIKEFIRSIDVKSL